MQNNDDLVKSTRSVASVKGANHSSDGLVKGRSVTVTKGSVNDSICGVNKGAGSVTKLTKDVASSKVDMCNGIQTVAIKMGNTTRSVVSTTANEASTTILTGAKTSTPASTVTLHIPYRPNKYDVRIENPSDSTSKPVVSIVPKRPPQLAVKIKSEPVFMDHDYGRPSSYDEEIDQKEALSDIQSCDLAPIEELEDSDMQESQGICDADVMKRYGLTKNVFGKFTCEICATVFQSKFNYLRHRMRGPCIHTCKKCGKSFNRRNELRHHQIFCQTNEKNHTCELCGKSYYTKRHLKVHFIQNHTSIRNYACKQCGKRFSEQLKLTQHERIHSTVKNCICHRCASAFNTPEKLALHMRKYRNCADIIKLKCTICGADFLFRKGLTQHVRKEHPEEFTKYIKDRARTREGSCKSSKLVQTKTLEVVKDGEKRIFPSQRKMLIFLKEAKKEKKRSDPSYKHECGTCNQLFRMKADLMLHMVMQKHGDIKSLSLASPGGNNSDTPYQKCLECNKSFASVKFLEAHVKVHQEEYHCMENEEEGKNELEVAVLTSNV